MESLNLNLNDDDFAGLADVLEVARSNIDEVLATQKVLAESVPAELRSDGDPRERMEAGLSEMEEAVESRDFSAYFRRQREQAGQLAESGVAFDVIAGLLSDLMRPFGSIVGGALAAEPDRRMRAMGALHSLETTMLRITGSAYAQAREDQVTDAFRSTIRRLSTPVVEVWDEVLVMPLVGVLDTSRAQQMMEQLLEKIGQLEARTVIIDITGVPTVDTAVAQHLIRTTKAARLVGADTLLVGISPQVAQTMVRLGVTLSDVATFADLRSGLVHALETLGYEITRSV